MQKRSNSFALSKEIPAQAIISINEIQSLKEKKLRLSNFQVIYLEISFFIF